MRPSSWLFEPGEVLGHATAILHLTLRLCQLVQGVFIAILKVVRRHLTRGMGLIVYIFVDDFKVRYRHQILYVRVLEHGGGARLLPTPFLLVLSAHGCVLIDHEARCLLPVTLREVHVVLISLLLGLLQHLLFNLLR